MKNNAVKNTLTSIKTTQQIAAMAKRWFFLIFFFDFLWESSEGLIIKGNVAGMSKKHWRKKVKSTKRKWKRLLDNIWNESAEIWLAEIPQNPDFFYTNEATGSRNAKLFLKKIS